MLLQDWERWVQQGGKQHQHPAVAKMQAAAAAGALATGVAGRAQQGAGGKACAAHMQVSLAQLAASDYMSDL